MSSQIKEPQHEMKPATHADISNIALSNQVHNVVSLWAKCMFQNKTDFKSIIAYCECFTSYMPQDKMNDMRSSNRYGYRYGVQTVWVHTNGMSHLRVPSLDHIRLY